MSCFSTGGICINHGACNANDGCMYALKPMGRNARKYRDGVVAWLRAGNLRDRWLETPGDVSLLDFIADAMKNNDIPQERE